MERDTLQYVIMRLALRFMARRCRIRALLLRNQLAPATCGREVEPAVAAEAYAGDLQRAGETVVGKKVVIVGCGPSNGLGYALVAAGAAKVWCCEPGVEFNVGIDAKDLNAFVVRHPKTRFHVVERVTSLDAVPAGGADIVLASSLPEKRADPATALAGLRRVLAPQGAMVLRLVYGDRLVRYPFHAMLFSKPVWRWLLGDPGQSRRRYDEHLADLARTGFAVTELEARRDPEGFARVAARLHKDYTRRDPAMLAVVSAVLCCRLRQEGGAAPV